MWGWSVSSRAHMNSWYQGEQGKSTCYSRREEGQVGLESGNCRIWEWGSKVKLPAVTDT